jgi:nitrate/nitrite-specific signal transduction histidine kinase
MSLERLKWLTIVLPIIFLAFAQILTGFFLEPVLGNTGGHWVAVGILAVGVAVFSTLVFRVLGGMQQRIVRQNEELSALNAEAQALYEIGLKIASLQDIQQILRSIVGQAREMLGSDAAALCLTRGNGGGLTLAGSSGPREAFRRSPLPVPPFPTAPDAASEGSLRRDAAAPCAMLTKEYRSSHLSAPLLVGTSVIGELCVSSRTAQGFSERQRELLAGLADMAAIAINNARLLEGERYLAVLEERERLAREMHDSLAQVLGYLHLRAQVAKRNIARRDVAKAEEELDDMATLAHEAYLDVREAILGLQETVSPATGIVGTLRAYLEKFSRQSGIKVEIEGAEDEVPPLSPEVEVQLVRVIQEALTNVRKHAHADTARIRIDSRDGETVINVVDNGRGFDPAVLQRRDGRRFGVRIMRERIERVGGRFEIESRPGSGTSVRIRFPAAEGRDR